MANPEVRGKIRRASAILTVGAILIGLTYEQYASKPNIPNRKQLETLYKPTAIRIGAAALRKAEEGGTQSSIRPDVARKDSFDITIHAFDGHRKLDILAIMRGRNGQPDPATTSDVLLEESFVNGTNIEEELMINKEGLGTHDWNALYDHYSFADQHSPEVSAVASQSDIGLDIDIARLADALSSDAFSAPGPLLA